MRSCRWAETCIVRDQLTSAFWNWLKYCGCDVQITNKVQAESLAFLFKPKNV